MCELMCEYLAEYTHISQMYLRNIDIRQKVDTLFGFCRLPKIIIIGIAT